jgi:lipid-A-disaccharide synthase-like uncharacterized protein
VGRDRAPVAAFGPRSRLTLVVAFQVWDAVGWAGQAVFTWRVVLQWVASERAKKSVIPPSFWAWSLLGAVLLVVYAAHRRDPVFVLGALVNGCIYARNLWMAHRGVTTPARPRRVLWPVVFGLLLFAGVSYEALGENHGIVQFGHPVVWLVVGFVGMTLWTGRFVVQWYVSERLGESVLPPAFFWMSLAGSVLLFLYALVRPGPDWVNIAAYALNPIPYARNLVLLYRKGASDGRNGAAKAEAP